MAPSYPNLAHIGSILDHLGSILDRLRFILDDLGFIFAWFCKPFCTSSSIRNKLPTNTYVVRTKHHTRPCERPRCTNKMQTQTAPTQNQTSKRAVMWNVMHFSVQDNLHNSKHETGKKTYNRLKPHSSAHNKQLNRSWAYSRERPSKPWGEASSLQWLSWCKALTKMSHLQFASNRMEPHREATICKMTALDGI